MLVVTRRDGEWIEITHKSGDVLWIRTYQVERGTPSTLKLGFDDEARNFEIHRPEAARLKLYQDPQPEEPAPDGSLQRPGRLPGLHRFLSRRRRPVSE